MASWWRRKPKLRLVVNPAEKWPDPIAYEFDRWVVIGDPSLLQPLSIADLDKQMLAEEKSRPSCMWDWISPRRIKTGWSDR